VEILTTNDVDVPILARNSLNENEQRTLGGFFKVQDPDFPTFKFIQTEVPLGIQRLAKSQGRSIDVDLTPEELLNGNKTPNGFQNGRDLSRIAGFMGQSNTINVDAEPVRKTPLE